MKNGNLYPFMNYLVFDKSLGKGYEVDYDPISGKVIYLDLLTSEDFEC